MDLELKNVEKTEEVQVIIDKMPTRTGYVLTGFVLCIVAVFFFFSFVIKYPDVVSGEITVSANVSPIKMIANRSGKIILFNLSSQAQVYEGQYLATIENSAVTEDVIRLKKLLKEYRLNPSEGLRILPRDISVGEINIKYFAFLNAVLQMANFTNDNILDKQRKTLLNLHSEYLSNIETSNNKLELATKNLAVIRKFISRDSILFSRKVITESEHDQSTMNLIAGQNSYQNILKDMADSRSEIQKIQKELNDNAIQNVELERQLNLNLGSTLRDLEDNIKAWEDAYTFISPISGKVQFMNFWTQKHYISQGQHVFTIVPGKTRIVGQMSLPAKGAGKVKLNQEVIIKLENYPYTEYGSIRGNVSGISLTPNTVTTASGPLNTYLINVDLPKGLKTNYGATLDFKFEIKGTGEIITNNRILFFRLFDNLKYEFKK